MTSYFNRNFSYEIFEKNQGVKKIIKKSFSQVLEEQIQNFQWILQLSLCILKIWENHFWPDQSFNPIQVGVFGGSHGRGGADSAPPL